MKKIIFLVAIIISINCSGKKDDVERNMQEIPTIVITDIHKKKVRHPNIDLVHLKSNPFKEIGWVMKIINLEDRYIIGDQMMGNAVFIYDLAGNYINHIHRVGQGPGEYKNIENIFYKEITNELVLFPMGGHKKLYFDIDGNYLREEHYKHSTRYADLIYFGHEELVANHAHLSGGNNLILLSENEVKNEYLLFDESYDDFRFNKLNIMVRESEHRILVSMGSRDTLYVYDHKDKTLTTRYVLNFNNKKIDLENFEIGKYVAVGEEKFLGMVNVFQNERILCFSSFTNTKDSFSVFFYDKQSHKLYSGKKVFENILKNGKVRLIVGMTNDGRFIGVIEPDKAEPLVFKNHKNLQKTYDGFNITDPDDKILLLFDIVPS